MVIDFNRRLTGESLLILLWANFLSIPKDFEYTE